MKTPTLAQLNSACMSYRHDFGLMTPDEQERLRWSAKEWLRAWEKENFTQPAPAWQPIETAPLTGKKLILFYMNRNNKARTVMARWLTDEEAAETDGDDVGLEGGWYECIDNWDDYTEVAIHEGTPTHWMPLPPAPESK